MNASYGQSAAGLIGPYRTVDPHAYVAGLVIQADIARDTGDLHAAKPLLEQALKASAELHDFDPLHAKIDRSYIDLCRRNKPIAADPTTTQQLQGLINTALSDTTTTTFRRPRLSTNFAPDACAPIDRRNQRRIKLSQLIQHPFLHHDILQSRALIALLSLVFMGVMTQMAMIPVKYQETGPVGQSMTLSNIQFKSADGLKVFNFLTDEKVSIYENGAVDTASYKVLSNIPCNFLTTTQGHLRYKEIFLLKTPAGLIDANGTTLYSPDAPELKIIERMWAAAGFAQWYFQSQKIYPHESTKNRDKTGLYYTNPFTGKPDYPCFISGKGANDKWLSYRTAHGQRWAKEPVPQAGAVSCLTLNFCRVLIRALDRDGKFITGSEPGTCFFIELQDGKNLTKDKLASYSAKASRHVAAQLPLRVYITDDPCVLQQIKLMRTFAPTLLALLLASKIIWTLTRKRVATRPMFQCLSMSTAALVTLILAAWYTMGFLP